MAPSTLARDPFEKIDQVSVSKVDYWVDQLKDKDFDADAVAELFFASKNETEVSTTLTKLTSLKENIVKILRQQVTSNYMTFIKARDTIRTTGLEMSELQELVGKTAGLVQDVRNNRLDSSRTMRKSSIIGMVSVLASTPKLGFSGIEQLSHQQGRQRSGSYSSSSGSDGSSGIGSSSDGSISSSSNGSSAYSDVDSSDEDEDGLPRSLGLGRKGGAAGDRDEGRSKNRGKRKGGGRRTSKGKDAGMDSEKVRRRHSSRNSASASEYGQPTLDLLEQYTNGTVDPNTVPGWFEKASDDLTNSIIEKAYTSAVKLICRVRDYGTAWKVQYEREKEAYKDAKAQGLDEDALALQGLSRDERRDAVGKQNVVKSVLALVEAKASHFSRILTDSIVNLPHSTIWGIAEQRKRLKMLIALGHYALAAEAFSKSRMDILQTVLRDVEASGDPKIYISDVAKGFYQGLLDVTMTFLQLFAKNAHTPSIMSILVMWCHAQTSALVGVLMKHIRSATKEHAALALIHLKHKVSAASDNAADISASAALGDGASLPVSPLASPVGPGAEEVTGSADTEAVGASRQRSDSVISALTAMSAPSRCMEVGGASNRRSNYNFRRVVGPLKFTRECLNIALQQAAELSRTGLQGFADLSWLLLPELKKLINVYSEDLLKETINQVRLDTWTGMRARAVSVNLPLSLLDQASEDSPFLVSPSAHVHGGNASGHEAPHGLQGGASRPLLGSSFDWLTVCLTHFIEDSWHLLRIPTSSSSATADTADRNSTIAADRAQGGDSHGRFDPRYSDDDDGERGWHQHPPTTAGEPVDADSDDSDYDCDTEDYDEVEIDESTGKPRYRKPVYRRMNFCEIEPIVVTSILRIITHYTIELASIDVSSDRFAGDGNAGRREVLQNTCQCLREVTIPSVHAFIERVFFNLHMCRVEGSGIESAPAPHKVLAESMKKLHQIEAKLSLT